MTTATALSPRIEALRADVVARKGSFITDMNPCLRDVAAWRAMQAGCSVVQVRAGVLSELTKIAPICILPHWRIAGEHLIPGPWAGDQFPLAGGDGEKLLPRLAELGIPAEQFGEVRAASQRWAWKSFPMYAVGEVDAQRLRGRGEWGRQNVFMAGGWIENHSIRDFAKVIRIGFGGIADEIAAAMAAADITDPDYVRKENFWRAALRVCEGGITLGRRYAEMAAKGIRDAADAEEAARLQLIADTCARVPRHGARTLHEAVQALWMAHVLTCGEDGINANSIGRLDQILQPYYQADLQAGRTTRQAALALMEELHCKLYLEYEVQATTLSGLDAEGNDATNEMTYVILESLRNVDFVRDVSVRLHRRSPQRLIELAAEMIAPGGGVPFLFNDDCFVPALAGHGISLADARNYAPIGCIELTVPGRANPHAVSGWLNAAKCLELALYNGVDPRTGQQVGPATGELAAMKDYEQFRRAFVAQMDHFTREMVYHCNRGELMQRERGPLPCWSVMTDDCIARGRDITDGGAVYNYHSIAFLGTANVADSLIAVRHLVFEQGQIAPAELLAAMKANFEGYEPLRQRLLNGAPKYGNGVAEVDEIAAWLANYFIDQLDRYRSPLGGRYVAHLFSFLCNVHFGKVMGATPDGRRAGEPIAYSLSAQQGRDVRGVTAALNTLARLPHDRAAGATAAIIDLTPKLVEGSAGVERLVHLIRSAINMGVGQLQFNVVTAERLKQAQQDPESFGNFPVRVAGYSQLFKLLAPELQDLVISRTKHSS